MVEQSTGDALKNSLSSGRSEQVSIATLKTDYAGFSGTSMATPHVAGVAALIKAVNHKLTPAQVREILTSTAVELEQTADNQFGSGLANAEAAVKAALKTK
jgi:subtilisin family serine protease